MPLMLASPAIPPSGEIPAQYTCDGADISPPLSWSDVPAETGSLVLVVEDPDARSGIGRCSTFRPPPAVSTQAIRQIGRPRLCTKPATTLVKPATAAPAHPEGSALITITSAYWRSAGRHSI